MSHCCRPGPVPLSIADRVAEHQHGIDVLPTPAHASPLEPCFDDHLVGAFHAPRTNGPACLLIGRVLHVRFTLLQVGQFLLDCCTRIASGHPSQVFEHPLRSLVLEPVQYSREPGGGQSASCCSHGLPDLIDVFGGMGKVQDTDRRRSVVVDQPLQPLRSILHRAHLCRPFQPLPMRFAQRCLRKALGVREARTGGDLLRTHLPPLVARDLPDRQRLDFDPLTPHQEHIGSIPTHRLFVHCGRRLGHLLLEALHLCLPHRQRRRSCRQCRAARRCLAHLHSHQVLQQLPCWRVSASSLPAVPAVPPHVESTLHSAALALHPGGKKPTPQVGQLPYVRVSLTASHPLVCSHRVCSPRANSGLPQVAHLGRSAAGFWLHSSVSPICTTSWINCARN